MCDNLSVSSPELRWYGRGGGGESTRVTPESGNCAEDQDVIGSDNSNDLTLKSRDQGSTRNLVKAVEENLTSHEKSDQSSGRKLVGKNHSSDETIAFPATDDGGDSRYGESTAVRHSGEEFGNRDPYGRRDERYNLSTHDQSATRLAKSIHSDEAVALPPTSNGSGDSGDGGPKERTDKDTSNRSAIRDGCYDLSVRDQSATRLAKSIRSDEVVVLSARLSFC
mmetsp:Transcript_46449/g.98518  ORF Transcript_46449/g.98518 Transcript_46449/m.98518 type:complete len:223 (-) Transcript_46449:145-813(-)